MKIVVPVKQVAALDEEFELLGEGVGVDPDFLEWDLNEWDTFSLEAALEIRERSGGDGDAEHADDGRGARGMVHGQRQLITRHQRSGREHRGDEKLTPQVHRREISARAHRK